MAQRVANLTPPRIGTPAWVMSQWLAVLTYVVLDGVCIFFLFAGVGELDADWFFLLTAFFIGQFVIGHSMMLLGPSVGKSLGLSKLAEVFLMPLMYLPFILLAAYFAGSVALGVILFLQMANGLRLLAVERQSAKPRFFLGLAQLILAFWITAAVVGLSGIEVGDPLIDTGNSLDRAEWTIAEGSRLAIFWMGLVYCVVGAIFAFPSIQRGAIRLAKEPESSAMPDSDGTHEEGADDATSLEEPPYNERW